MENFVVSLEFLGGLACLFAVGHLVGHLLKLDKYHYNDTKDNKEIHQKSAHL